MSFRGAVCNQVNITGELTQGPTDDSGATRLRTVSSKNALLINIESDQLIPNVCLDGKLSLERCSASSTKADSAH